MDTARPAQAWPLNQAPQVGSCADLKCRQSGCQGEKGEGGRTRRKSGKEALEREGESRGTTRPGLILGLGWVRGRPVPGHWHPVRSASSAPSQAPGQKHRWGLGPAGLGSEEGSGAGLLLLPCTCQRLGRVMGAVSALDPAALQSPNLLPCLH